MPNDTETTFRLPFCTDGPYVKDADGEIVAGCRNETVAQLLAAAPDMKAAIVEYWDALEAYREFHGNLIVDAVRAEWEAAVERVHAAEKSIRDLADRWRGR